MAEDTVHRTRIDYVAEDHASGVAHRIAQAYREPAEAVMGLKERFRELRQEGLLMAAGGLGVGFGIGALVDKAKDVNREFYGANKAIASTLSTVLEWPKSVDAVDRYNRSLRLSAGITEQLDEKAADMGSSLGAVSQAYKTIAIATAPLHLSQQQLLDLTEKSTAASIRFGMDASAAADDIGRAMVTHTIRPFGDLGIFLRQNIHGNLRAMNNPQLLAQFDKALSGSVETAKVMSAGMGGSILKIQHQIDDAVRHVSGPLFKEVAKSVTEIYQKLKQTTAEGRPLMDVYGQKLVTVFHDLKDTAGFIVDHWKVLAAIWATAKVPKLFEGAAALAGGIAGLNPFAGIAGLSKLGASGGVGGIGGLLSILGPATQGIFGLATAAGVAAIALKGVYDEWQSRKHQAADLGGFFKEMGEVAKTQAYIQKHEGGMTPEQIEAGRQYAREHAGLAAEVLKQKGLLQDGSLAMEKFNGVMDSMSDDVKKSFGSMVPGAPDASSGILGAYVAEVFRKNYQAPAAAIDAGNGDENRRTSGKTFNFFGNVNINQKFEDQDPDRVAVRLKDDLENYTNRRTQSALSTAGGF